jgi:hypothetical protein
MQARGNRARHGSRSWEITQRFAGFRTVQREAPCDPHGANEIRIVARRMQRGWPCAGCSLLGATPQEGIMSLMFRTLVIAGAAIATAAPAAAQTFDVSMDCGGVWAPGDVMPWAARFEEQGFFDHQLDVRIKVTNPRGGTQTIVNTSFTLFSNQDRTFNRDLVLPANAIAGGWSMQVWADDGVDRFTDTCSFDVN